MPIQQKTIGCHWLLLQEAARCSVLAYKDAGVNIKAESELVRRIANMAPGIGGFGGLFPFGTVLLLNCLFLFLWQVNIDFSGGD